MENQRVFLLLLVFFLFFVFFKSQQVSVVLENSSEFESGDTTEEYCF